MGMHPNTQGRVWCRVEHQALWMYSCHINHIIYGHFRPFLGRHASDVPRLKRIILFVDVTSFAHALVT